MSEEKKNSLLVVSQYYYPEQFRINDICAEWVKRGYEVTVITGIPNYPQGKFYDSYGWFCKRHEVHDDVKIIRLPIVARGKNKLLLAINYLSFVISGLIWSLFSRIEADLVFCFGTSPMTQALPAVWFAKRKHIPMFIYMQDLWPENFQEATGIHFPLVINAIARMAKYVYNNSEKVFVTSKSFIQAISQRGIPEDKIAFWPQYAEEFYRPTVTRSSVVPVDDRFTIAFTGNVGTSQGLEILPRTAALLKHSGVSVRFLIVGEGRGLDRLQQEIEKEAVKEYFVFVPQQPPQKIPGILAHADAAFVSFADKQLFSMTIPAKLQSYMACGMPILAAVGGETAKIVSDAACGLCCRAGDTAALARNIQRMMLMTNMDLQCWGANAFKYAKTHFSRNSLLDEMDTFLKGAL